MKVYEITKTGALLLTRLGGTNPHAVPSMLICPSVRSCIRLSIQLFTHRIACHKPIYSLTAHLGQAIHHSVAVHLSCHPNVIHQLMIETCHLNSLKVYKMFLQIIKSYINPKCKKTKISLLLLGVIFFMKFIITTNIWQVSYITLKLFLFFDQPKHNFFFISNLPVTNF